MEESSNPSPIKEYYIGYFDILGYRQFFIDQPEKAEVFLTEIHNAIANTKRHLFSMDNNNFLKNILKVDVDIKIKIFSDNILLCLERCNDTEYEKSRALLFLVAISEIQRSFIIVHDLVIRGGVTIGNISFNDDYIFGTGLIEAVEIEETAFYPRIIVSESFSKYILSYSLFTDDEFINAQEIEKKIQNKETVSQIDNELYSRILRLYQSESMLIRVFCNLVAKDYDNTLFVSYLYKMNPMDYMNSEMISNILDLTEQVLPDISEELNRSLINIISGGVDDMLTKHKQHIEEEIKKYGDYTKIKLSNCDEATQHKRAASQERVLKKYVWAMKYHNDMCTRYNKLQFFINSTANCDAKFMLLTVTILDKHE